MTTHPKPAPLTEFKPNLTNHYEPPGWMLQAPPSDAKGTEPKFIAVKGTVIVMRASELIAKACSRTMARRIANALNKYVPNRKGY
jgi:hypothetical protein